jgi:MFS family permease
MDSPSANKTFQTLLLCWMVAGTAMWMNDVSAAWIMSSLSTDPLMIALVQTASTLPVFFLGLPFGALADMLDRRRMFILTQIWGAVIAVLFAISFFFDLIGPWLILALVLCNGAGLAMRGPVFSALVPNIVKREQLRSALAMNSLATNASRVLGPLCAGLLIAAAGPGWVFVCNGVLCAITSVMLLRWRFRQPPRTEPVEPIVRAMAEGLRFLWHSVAMRMILLRTVLVFSQAIIIIAMLPLVARALPGAGAGTYGVMFAFMGLGAVTGAMFIARLTGVLGAENTLRIGRFSHAMATLTVALAPNLWVAIPGMYLAGMSWMVAGNTMTVAAQLHLPDRLRARGMSVYQTALIGGGAIGAAYWGQIASLTSVRTAMLLSVVVALILLALTHRFNLPPEPASDHDATM